MKKQFSSAIGVFMLVCALLVPNNMAADKSNKRKRAIKKAMPVFKRVCGVVAAASGLMVTAALGHVLYMGIIEVFPNEISVMRENKILLVTNLHAKMYTAVAVLFIAGVSSIVAGCSWLFIPQRGPQDERREKDTNLFLYTSLCKAFLGKAKDVQAQDEGGERDKSFFLSHPSQVYPELVEGWSLKEAE